MLLCALESERVLRVCNIAQECWLYSPIGGHTTVASGTRGKQVRINWLAFNMLFLLRFINNND